MSTAALMNGIGLPFWSRTGQALSVTAPPRRVAPPVLIHDAITPWNGETMLLSLLRAQALADLEDQPPNQP